MSGLEFVGGTNALRAKLEEYVAAGRAGLDAGIVTLAETAKVDMKAVLTEQSHERGTKTPATRGGPPAKITGDLAGSIDKAVKFRVGGAIAFIGPVSGFQKFVARLMERGWHPNGGRRRTKREQKALHPTNGKVKFPFIRDVELRTIAQAGPIVSEAVGLSLRGVR